MRHAISYGARTYNWPSLAAASAELRKRIDAASKRGRPCQ